MLRALTLTAAASLVAACFTDALPSDLSAGPQTTGSASSTGAPTSTGDAATTTAGTTGAPPTGTTTLDPTAATDPATAGTTGVDGTTTGGTTAGATTGAGLACDPPLYSTDFSLLDQGWSPLTMNWSLSKDGWYYNDTALELSATMRPGESYGDVAISVVMKVPAAGAAGVAFRVDDDLTGYYVAVDGDQHRLRFGKIALNDLTSEWDGPLAALPGSTVTLTAVSQGADLTILLDGQEVAQGLDVGGVSGGPIGLFAAKVLARFDAVEVCALD